jgi:hypothetical protein
MQCHVTWSRDGLAWIPVFSSAEALASAGSGHSWQTDGGELQMAALPFEDLVAVLNQAFLDEQTGGIVFDLGLDTQLVLSSDEVLSLAAGTAIPITDLAGQQPARGDEQMYVGEPAESSEQLVSQIQQILGREPHVTGSHLYQVFIPERDVMPHLLLSLTSPAADATREEIGIRVSDAVAQLDVPPPGYIDVMFDFDPNSVP